MTRDHKKHDKTTKNKRMFATFKRNKLRVEPIKNIFHWLKTRKFSINLPSVLFDQSTVIINLIKYLLIKRIMVCYKKLGNSFKLMRSNPTLSYIIVREPRTLCNVIFYI